MQTYVINCDMFSAQATATEIVESVMQTLGTTYQLDLSDIGAFVDTVHSVGEGTKIILTGSPTSYLTGLKENIMAIEKTKYNENKIEVEIITQ